MPRSFRLFLVLVAGLIGVFLAWQYAGLPEPMAPASLFVDRKGLGHILALFAVLILIFVLAVRRWILGLRKIPQSTDLERPDLSKQRQRRSPRRGKPNPRTRDRSRFR